MYRSFYTKEQMPTIYQILHDGGYIHSMTINHIDGMVEVVYSFPGQG